MNLENSQAPAQTDRFKNLLVLLAIANTLLVVILASLQSDATIRATVADRDSQYYAVKASGELHRSGLASNYDFMILAETLKNQQENLILMMTALEQQMQGNEGQADVIYGAAAVAQAKAGVGNIYSILFNDPRFSPAEPGGMPDLPVYLEFLNAKANEWVGQQNSAVDSYHLWNKKSDDYAMILTIVSVSFLLFGVGQAATDQRLRVFFTIIGGYIQVFSVIWTIIIVLN